MRLSLLSPRSLAAFAAFAACTALSLTASADPTPNYKESRVEGGSVVSFETDGLRADGNSFLGDTIRRPPGAVRVGLIRPRFNFVPEMLKSVENL
ncbi:MAG: hypothetical protein IPF92_01590 [Myxococcales bacterium]|jgi:hypothetical protein|nr:hypothetical protein [Myxococcales bacterium]MBL0193824.1 hypothetical protein [Myxococcales bacterium]HQY63590.1 hypothetical protein [Polyangiaceae bacterium]